MKRFATDSDTTVSNKRKKRETDEEPDSSVENKLNAFEVTPVSRFNGKFPDFRRPLELGSFSLDADRAYVNDRSQLRAFRPPPNDRNSGVRWDLRSGYNSFIKRDESIKEYLDHLLEWIQTNKTLATGAQREESGSGGKSRYVIIS
jgi:hypothetical protein